MPHQSLIVSRSLFPLFPGMIFCSARWEQMGWAGSRCEVRGGGRMFQAWLTLPAQSPSPVPVGMEPPPQGDKECQAALKQHPQPTEPWQGLKLGDGEMSERAGRKAEERGSPPCELQMLWRPRAHSELSLVCRDLEGMTAPRVLSNSEGLKAADCVSVTRTGMVPNVGEGRRQARCHLPASC